MFWVYNSTYLILLHPIEFDSYHQILKYIRLSSLISCGILLIVFSLDFILTKNTERQNKIINYAFLLYGLSEFSNIFVTDIGLYRSITQFLNFNLPIEYILSQIFHQNMILHTIEVILGNVFPISILYISYTSLRKKRVPLRFEYKLLTTSFLALSISEIIFRFIWPLLDPPFWYSKFTVSFILYIVMCLLAFKGFREAYNGEWSFEFSKLTDLPISIKSAIFLYGLNEKILTYILSLIGNPNLDMMFTSPRYIFLFSSVFIQGLLIMLFTYSNRR